MRETGPDGDLVVAPRTALPMMATNHDGGELNIKITKESCKACDKFIQDNGIVLIA